MFDESPVKMQQCFTVDTFGFIKLLLYGKYTDKIGEGKVRQFNKVLIKATKNERYANTTKNENECVISSTECFSEALSTPENTASPITERSGKIIGITECIKNTMMLFMQQNSSYSWQYNNL